MIAQRRWPEESCGSSRYGHVRRRSRGRRNFQCHPSGVRLSRKAGGSNNHITALRSSVPMRYQVHAAAKAGVDQLTRNRALEGGEGVRVNAIAPGRLMAQKDSRLMGGSPCQRRVFRYDGMKKGASRTCRSLLLLRQTRCCVLLSLSDMDRRFLSRIWERKGKMIVGLVRMHSIILNDT